MKYIKKYEHRNYPKYFNIGDKVIVGNSGWSGSLKEFIENNVGEIISEHLTLDYIVYKNEMIEDKDWTFNVKFDMPESTNIDETDNKIWFKQTQLRKATEEEIYNQELKTSQNKFNL